MRDRAQQSWPQLSKTEYGDSAAKRSEIRVGEDHVGTLAAQLQADLLDVARGRSHDLPPRGRLASEGHFADAGVSGDGGAGRAAGAGDNVEDSRREARLEGEFGDADLPSAACSWRA